jgi:hypothetical protein
MVHAAIAFVTAGVLLVGGGAVELQSCDTGYRTFLGDFTKLIYDVSSEDAVDAVKKSLAVYDSCKAGDSYEPAGAWRKILDDLKSKSAR